MANMTDDKNTQPDSAHSMTVWMVHVTLPAEVRPTEAMFSNWRAALDHVKALSRDSGVLAASVVTPDRIIESFTEPSAHADDDSPSGYRVVVHVSRDNGGTRLVPDVSWPDARSVRLFVTALMRNLTKNSPAQQRRRCWCEVWTPDETGEFVDSAILNPDTGAIEWESDIIRRTQPS